MGAMGAIGATGATGALSLGIVLLGLFASSALRQERLFAVQQGRYDALPTVVAELDTRNRTFGQVRRVLHVPTPASVIRLAGGRYLLITHQPNYTGPVIVGVFDTRSFTFVHSLTFPGRVTLVPDEFHPRVFYRTLTEVGVLELPYSPAVCCGPPRTLRFRIPHSVSAGSGTQKPRIRCSWGASARGLNPSS